MAFKLYNAPSRPAASGSASCFNTKKLPFDEVKLNLLAGDQLKPDYLKLNPNGVVPTLDHDGQIVIDSNVITEYLDEVAPRRASRRSIRWRVPTCALSCISSTRCRQPPCASHL